MGIDIFKQTSVHEIGHVLMAYHFKYAVNYTMWEKASPGEGKTEISWKPDHKRINILLNPSIFPHEMAYLIDKHFGEISILIEKYIMIATAGTAAEVNNEIETLGTTSINALNAFDNDDIVNFLDQLRPIGIDINDSFVNECFVNSRKLFLGDKYLKAIEYLSELLLSKPDHRLGKAEIEDYLAAAQL